MTMHAARSLVFVSLLAATVLAMACSSSSPAPATEGQRLDSANASSSALDGFRRDPKAGKFFDTAYGWAVFPKITKGAVGLGVASGSGEVYVGGSLIGYAKVTSVTIGAQIGGQTFSEIIFFENRFALDKFKNNQFTGSASAGAVAGESGGLNMADYSHGVAIFTRNNSGLIVAADVGGQKFEYESK
ncbi:MAG: lipid-binding SYLF domain-containing protein [Phycisphaerales bacterium]|jgi:lipid-binding SYLF domain-containing protein|nr:lipid-binding SYLF domain-containing protein [Phycisphaerales bacterium]